MAWSRTAQRAGAFFLSILLAFPAAAGGYQNGKFGYRIQFPDGWTIAEDAANDAIRANKPDGSIQLAVQALDLQGKIASADALADLFTARVFNQFRFHSKRPDHLNALPVVSAGYSGQDGGRAVVIGAVYLVQGSQGFVFYAVMDADRADALAQESDAVFRTFSRGAAVAMATPAATDACSQVLGQWKWFTGNMTEFRADGTMAGNVKHRWRCADAGRRIISIVWNNGQWVDTLVLSSDGRSLEGKNQQGSRVWGKR